VLTVVTLLTTGHHERGPQHGERPFWREWGATYVRRFFAGARRHIQEPFRAVCLTDSAHLLPADVEPLLLHAPIPGGWWAKLATFDARHGIEGRTLFCDLDNIIGGDLSPLLALEPDPLLALDDLIEPRRFNSSTMFCYPERLRFLWDTFAEDPQGWMHQYLVWPHASDQAFIWDQLRERGLMPPHFLQDLLPKGAILNSRVELEKGAPWEQAMLVYGSWDPKPHMSSHPFYARHWVD